MILRNPAKKYNGKTLAISEWMIFSIQQRMKKRRKKVLTRNSG